MPTIKVHDLAYIRVRLPDLERAEKFLTDFGLLRVERTEDRLYMRGTGPSHHIHVTERGDDKLLSLAFSAASQADLQAATSVPGASVIEDIQEPGGGKRVWLSDPDGNRIEIVWGIKSVDPIALGRHPLNDALNGLQRAGMLMRHQHGPSKVLRIAHALLSTTSPPRMLAWYREHLGLLCSDEIVLQDGAIGLSFNRLDRGKEFVDHHVLGIQSGATPGLNHVSFEIQDVDDLMLGHEHLKRQGHEAMWGIGRHVYGSQIFDYWLDPWGFMYEHWTDTDRLNADFVGLRDATIESANGPWGMDVPERFLTHVHP